MYHFNHILYTVILIAVPFMTFIIWSIVGRPRIVKPKQWRQPKAFDVFAKADLELFRTQHNIHPDADKLLELDEHETKIS